MAKITVAFYSFSKAPTDELLEENLSSATNKSTNNHMWTGPKSNTDLCGKKPTTDLLSDGIAQLSE